MEKIQFKNGQEPYLNDINLNKMQDNIEKAINEKADEVKLDEKLDKTGGTIQGNLNIEGNITQNGAEIALLKTCVPYRSFSKLDESVLDDIPTLLGADYQSR